MKTTDPQERDKPDGAEPPEWTWFIENPPGHEPAAKEAAKHQNDAHEEVAHCPDTRPNAPHPLWSFWITRPTMAFVIVYLLMALGIACILEFELRPTADSPSSEGRSVPSELEPVAAQSGIHSSPTGGASSGYE